MSYPVYPEYKDSGVEWLGEVPNHWEIRRLKYACRLITKKISTDGHNVIALENIEGFTGKYIETDQKYSGEDVGFKEGDILFGKLRPYLGKVFLAENVGVAFGDLLVYRPSKDVKPSYAFSQMISDGFISEVDSSTYGSKMPRAGVDFVNDMLFLLTEDEEQTKIATFLDRETQKIDHLIDKQQQLIKLLQEKRQAVIAHAVTKGLNPNAKMKDSGVEWLGEIPVHWSMWKVAHACPYTGSGTTPKTDSNLYYGGNNLWVTTGELREGGIFDTKKHVTDQALIDMPTLRLHPKGSIAIAMYGATIGRLGIFEKEATTNQACCVMPPSEILNNKYLFYWLYATRQEIINLSSGGGQPNVNQEKVSSLKVSAPYIKEQTKIATFLDRETQKIDRLIKKTKEAIQLSKERRTALISAAVTGKIDVRQVANG